MKPHPCKASYEAILGFPCKTGFLIGPAYRCFKLVKTGTKSQVILDTLEFCHSYLSIPVPSMEDKIIHGLHVIAGAMQGAPPPTSFSQIKAITALQEIFESWSLLVPPSLRPNHCLAPASPRVNSCKSPRVVASPPPSTNPM
jgi:hypothetical protein